MSKVIYDEALEILLDSFTDPQDEDNDCFMFNFRQIIKIKKAILIAQEQEKLLKLYIDLGNEIQVLDNTQGYGILEIDEIKNICNKIKKENKGEN